jgi:hypothetical protein
VDVRVIRFRRKSLVVIDARLAVLRHVGRLSEREERVADEYGRFVIRGIGLVCAFQKSRGFGEEIGLARAQCVHVNALPHLALVFGVLLICVRLRDEIAHLFVGRHVRGRVVRGGVRSLARPLPGAAARTRHLAAQLLQFFTIHRSGKEKPDDATRDESGKRVKNLVGVHN